MAWIGRAADVPARGAVKAWNIGGKDLTPGLVDPHSHIVLARRGWSISRCRRKGGMRWDLWGRGGGVGALVPPNLADGYACQVRSVKCGAFGMLA